MSNNFDPHETRRVARRLIRIETVFYGQGSEHVTVLRLNIKYFFALSPENMCLSKQSAVKTDMIILN